MRLRRNTRLAAALIVLGLLVAVCSASGAAAQRQPRAAQPPAGPPQLTAQAQQETAASAPPIDARHVPVYAYFYQWFNAASWNRAKQDFPLAGKYSSDDPHVLRDQVHQAQAAGIEGFLTSWKRTDPLDRRLELLLRVAHDERFDVGVVYQGLDFARRPLPIATVESDMVYLVTRWGSELSATTKARPLIIWTGTDEFSVRDVQRVRSALSGRAELLAASKSVSGYERVADLVDGNAYYWSSANPAAEATSTKLTEMGAAVHAHHGLWIAPAASGFDGRTLGRTRVIPRDAGMTLTRSLAVAFATRPDAVGVISWNEWSENTYIEPGERYGQQELVALRNFLQRGGASGALSISVQTSGYEWSGVHAAILLTVITVLIIALLSWRMRRRRGRAGRHFHSGGSSVEELRSSLR
jgi:hypothetical protein